MRVLWVTLKLALFCAILIAACVWLADQPGQLDFTWNQARVQMPTSIGMILVLLLCMVLWKAGKFFFWIKYGAARRAESKLRQRDRQGLDLLTASFNALAARDLVTATKAQQRAKHLLGDVPLATWLGAQIAARQEHGAEARQAFLALTATPNAANLGWRGLMGLRRDDAPQGMTLPAPLLSTALANKATARQPYLHEARLADAVRGAIQSSDWSQARAALHDATRYHALPKARLRRLEQAILMGRAMSLMMGDATQARLLLEQAYRLDPSFTPAALALLNQLMVMGDTPAAGKLLSALWLTVDDDEAGERFAATLIGKFIKLYSGETPQARLERFERLAKKRQQALTTHLALARLNLDAAYHDQARIELDRAQKMRPTPTAYRLLAELAATGTTGNKAQYYMERAQEAAVTGWRCASCGAAYADWQILCDDCGMVATIEAGHAVTTASLL